MRRTSTHSYECRPGGWEATFCTQGRRKCLNCQCSEQYACNFILWHGVALNLGLALSAASLRFTMGTLSSKPKEERPRSLTETQDDNQHTTRVAGESDYPDSQADIARPDQPGTSQGTESGDNIDSWSANPLYEEPAGRTLARERHPDMQDTQLGEKENEEPRTQGSCTQLVSNSFSFSRTSKGGIHIG